MLRFFARFWNAGLPLAGALLLTRAPAPAAAQVAPVAIGVDFAQPKGPMQPLWAYFGYDEPNYTTMPDGQKLLTELAALSPVPVYVRAHNMLTTGDGVAALKWGSTNAYTEDKNGQPVYNWTIVDQIFDAYRKRSMKPIAQLGFMPEALSTHPAPYRHHWQPGDNYNDIYTGWAYPPKDYAKWGELVYQWVRHSVARYGEAEVKTWRWELWNEPNIGYWKGTPEEYQALRLHRGGRAPRPARRPARWPRNHRPRLGQSRRLLTRLFGALRPGPKLRDRPPRYPPRLRDLSRQGRP